MTRLFASDICAFPRFVPACYHVCMPAITASLTLRLPERLLTEVDARRGAMSRNAWLVWAVERALGEASDPDPGYRAQPSVRQAASDPAPAEQPGPVAELGLVEHPVVSREAAGSNPVVTARRHAPNCKCPVCA